MVVQGTNSIAVEVHRPYDYTFPPGFNCNISFLILIDGNSTDLAITFVDWTYYPADYNMGLWREVVYEIVNPVSIRYPAVSSSLTTDLSTADLQVIVELSNWVDSQVTVRSTLKIL